MQDQKVHKNLLNSVFVLTLMTNQNEMTTYTSTSIDIAVEEHHEIIIITKKTSQNTYRSTYRDRYSYDRSSTLKHYTRSRYDIYGEILDLIVPHINPIDQVTDDIHVKDTAHVHIHEKTISKVYIFVYTSFKTKRF